MYRIAWAVLLAVLVLVSVSGLERVCGRRRAGARRRSTPRGPAGPKGRRAAPLRKPPSSRWSLRAGARSPRAPRSLAARWRLMRALYFKGEHATTGQRGEAGGLRRGEAARRGDARADPEEAGASAGKDLSKATPVELVPYVKGRTDVAACFLWASVSWGKWALVFGKTAAARQGAAAKIRDYATAVVRLDPTLEEGGGYRVLGRLHHQTPAIPFITGWASRTEALRNLRLAVETAPRNFINRLYLAEAIWDYEKEKRPEARRMLEGIVADRPSAAFAVEDARAQEDARALLAAWAHE